jgi:hypothetical protein
MDDAEAVSTVRSKSGISRLPQYIIYMSKYI